jgi:hypothetical protein
LISLSPLSSAHPSCFQPTLVRASNRCYPAFTLAKDRSLSFASIPNNYTPCSDSVSLRLLLICGLTSLPGITSRLIMQKARRHPLARAPTACRYTVSGTISLPSQGFFSPFPHGTGSLSVAKEYLALRDGPRCFPQDSSCPVVLRIPSPPPSAFRLQACHLLWCGFPARFD